jgi:hypothetical protein
MMKFASYVAPWPWTPGMASKPKPEPLKDFFKKIKWRPV